MMSATAMPMTAKDPLDTEVDFCLPRGLLTSAGAPQRQGRMRLATAYDEIEVMADPRLAVNWALLPALLLSRVVTRIGDITAITPDLMLTLFAMDLAYLSDLYQRLNGLHVVTLAACCPHCSRRFALHTAPLEPGLAVENARNPALPEHWAKLP